MYEDIRKIFAEYGLSITTQMAEKYLVYYELVMETNKVMNLTAITDFEEFVVKHLVDSVQSAKFIPSNATVLDIGAGAGFPSIPLKIFRNDINITMVDSLNKRVEFLKRCNKLLGFQEAYAIHSRAEDLPEIFRGNFDIVTARAVANLSTLAEYCLPYVKIGGNFIAYKSVNLEELDKAYKPVEMLGGEIRKHIPYSLKSFGDNHELIIIDKIKKTPDIYPRGKNLPKMKPLS